MAKQLGKIILYNHGIVDTEVAMDRSAGLVCALNPKDNIHCSPIILDGYLGGQNFSDESSKEMIGQQLEALAKLIKSKPHKNYHLATRLGGPEGIQPVALQIERVKYIVDFFKVTCRFTNPIILVGHSQGGLVNLGVSLDYPEKISRLISISTPYKPNGLAKEFLQFVPPVMFKAAIKKYATAFKEKPLLYVRGVNYLKSRKAYQERLTRWNALQGKIPLHIIANVAGKRVIYAIGFIPRNIQPTDGLVTHLEQTSFPSTTTDLFIDQEIGCILDNTEQYKKGCLKCTRVCPYSSFALRDLLLQLGRQIVRNKNGLNDLLHMGEHVIKNEPNSEGNYDELYRIFIHPYSHAQIRFYPGVIQLIAKYINLD